MSAIGLGDICGLYINIHRYGRFCVALNKNTSITRQLHDCWCIVHIAYTTQNQTYTKAHSMISRCWLHSIMNLLKDRSLLILKVTMRHEIKIECLLELSVTHAENACSNQNFLSKLHKSTSQNYQTLRQTSFLVNVYYPFYCNNFFPSKLFHLIQYQLK